jgi:hypothetical protein
MRVVGSEQENGRGYSILGSEYFSGVLAKVFIRVAKLLQEGKKSLLGNRILLGPFSIFFHTYEREC